MRSSFEVQDGFCFYGMSHQLQVFADPCDCCFQGFGHPCFDPIYGCTKCGESMTRNLVKDDATGHKLTKVEAKKAGCMEDGNAEYWFCDPEDDGCGKYFADEEGKQEIKPEETVVSAMTSDADPAGTAFRPLCMRLKKASKSSIKVVWNKVAGAKRYIVYANACGKKNKLKKQKSSTTRSFTLKKLKKGTYYKFMVAALDANGRVLTVSRIVHIATKGGKAGNYRKVTTKAKFKKIKLKKGKKLRLKVKTVADSKPRKVKKHVKVRFETTNPAVATVSKKGVIKAKGKGTCLVYAYAQNGVYLKVKVTVR